MSMIEIPIFRAGKYPQGTFDTRTLRKAVETTNRLIREGVFRPPVKLGHDDSGDASGWLESLREAGGVVYATLADLSADLRDRIARKARRFVSAEIEKEFSPDGQVGRSVGTAFTGLAVLGASRPQLKGLIDLATIELSEVAARGAGIVRDGLAVSGNTATYFAELGEASTPATAFAEVGVMASDFEQLASNAEASQRVSKAVRIVMQEKPALAYGAAFREARARVTPKGEMECFFGSDLARASDTETAQMMFRIMARKGLSHSEFVAEVQQRGFVIG